VASSPAPGGSRWPRCWGASTSSIRQSPPSSTAPAGTSAIAASALSAHGFALVADLLGGYDAWKAAGLPIETPTGATA